MVSKRELEKELTDANNKIADLILKGMARDTEHRVILAQKRAVAEENERLSDSLATEREITNKLSTILRFARKEMGLFANYPGTTVMSTVYADIVAYKEMMVGVEAAERLFGVGSDNGDDDPDPGLKNLYVVV